MHTARLIAISIAVALLAALPGRAAAQDLSLRGAPTGTLTTRSCPAGSVLTGLRARVGLAVDAVGLRCRPVRTDGTLGSETSVGTYAGGTGGTERIRSCPTGTVAVGQRIGFLPTMPMNVIVIGLHCRRWDAATRSTTGSSAVTEVVTSLAAAITTFNDACSSARAPIRAFRARTGVIVDALGFTCGVP